jgi:hypothetical protein
MFLERTLSPHDTVQIQRFIRSHSGFETTSTLQHEHKPGEAFVSITLVFRDEVFRCSSMNDA